jgi:hypothetical protein
VADVSINLIDIVQGLLDSVFETAVIDKLIVIKF